MKMKRTMKDTTVTVTFTAEDKAQFDFTYEANSLAMVGLMLIAADDERRKSKGQEPDPLMEMKFIQGISALIGKSVIPDAVAWASDHDDVITLDSFISGIMQAEEGKELPNA